MLKMIYLCRRRPDISHVRYAELVLGSHAPLALKHHPTMRRYVINIAEGGPPEGPELDSLPALSFDSLEDAQERLYDSPEGQEFIRRDVERFMGGVDAYATRERVHLDEGPRAATGRRSPGVKLTRCLMRRPELDRNAFLSRWLDGHTPLVQKHRPGLARYATSAVEQRLSETGEDWDGFEELHFPSEAAASRFASATSESELAADLERFVGRALVYPVAEYVWK